MLNCVGVCVYFLFFFLLDFGTNFMGEGDLALLWSKKGMCVRWRGGGLVNFFTRWGTHQFPPPQLKNKQTNKNKTWLNLSARLLVTYTRYTTSKLQLQCSAASGASCTVYTTNVPGNETNHLDNSTSSNNGSTLLPWVQSFLITSTVMFTRVPAQEPTPVIS